ncbi:hypothetical protein N7456_002824 [Penicillium angulare]|uniref:Uncharacterized protein n=1 Tax=Penicillium angulare TaxID=116970 RepID=A0A9W9FTM7_9EURO|nr:hypothetical protein N7456_002824 [Penicillium angulare]
MSAPKEYLNAKDFEDGLAVLDDEMGKNPWLIAFAPIRLISAGGFIAVSYLKNRDSTGDLDYLIDPEFAGDKDIEGALKGVIISVADQLRYNRKWVNGEMGIFVTKKTRQVLFEQAIKQGITLFKGQNLEVLAAPVEWALERKLRRIYAADRDRKVEGDIADATALLKYLKERNDGPLDLEEIRTMNTNGFDVIPDHTTMQRVADAYRRNYNEDIFK